MAKKNTVDEMIQDIRAELPTPNAEVKAKVELIKSFFQKIENIEGVAFDPSNPDHVLIAAWSVGMRRYLVR